MTGSEPSSTSLSGSDGGKSQDAEQQVQQKECDHSSDGSSPSDGSKTPLPTSCGSKSPSSNSSSDKSSHSPSSDLQSSSNCPSSLSIETKVGGVPSLLHTAKKTAVSSAGHSKMKRTVSNCNVRNTSTLCSKESSYVYHCPARRRTQLQKRGHPKVPDANPAPLSSLDAVTSQSHLTLMEDSDETQSMVELGIQPFRARGLHGSSLRRGDSRNGHASLRTTHPGTSAPDVDHLQPGRKIPEKQPAGRRQLLGHPLQQMSHHMTLERVHSVGGRPAAQIPGAQQEQLLLGHRQTSPPGLHPTQQPHPLTQQHLPHHPLAHQHHMIGRRGGSIITKPHTAHNGHPVVGGLTRVLSTQVPRTKISAYLLPDSRVKLHVPSGRKLESLV